MLGNKKALIHINFICLLLVFSAPPVHAYDFNNWHRRFIGYEIAKMDAEKQCSPLVIYFYIDSDEWTEKMNNEYIATYQIDRFLSNIPNKVAIDALNDLENEGLARDLGVETFPAFLISIPCLKSEVHRVQPFLENNQMTKDAFIVEMKKFFTYHYNNSAHSLYTEKKYEKALELLNKSMEFDTENPYTYQIKGFIYHEIGAEKKDTEALKLAEENYKKALELDPENKELKEELAKIINHNAL